MLVHTAYSAGISKRAEYQKFQMSSKGKGFGGKSVGGKSVGGKSFGGKGPDVNPRFSANPPGHGSGGGFNPRGVGSSGRNAAPNERSALTNASAAADNVKQRAAVAQLPLERSASSQKAEEALLEALHSKGTVEEISNYFVICVDLTAVVKLTICVS